MISLRETTLGLLAWIDFAEGSGIKWKNYIREFNTYTTMVQGVYEKLFLSTQK